MAHTSFPRVFRIPQKNLRMFFSIVAVALIVHGVLPVYAADVRLTWDPPPTEYGGFMLEYGTSSRQYDQSQDVGAQTAETVTNLTPGQTYYFAVKSYDPTHTTESPYSEEVVTTIAHPAPVSDFHGTPTSGSAPLQVAFTDASSGTADSWSWNFGDGSTSTERHPTHTYADAGNYSVTLTVSGNGGSSTKTHTEYIVVSEREGPKANFTATPVSGTSPLAVTFADSSTGSVTSWHWDFGDGTSSTNQHPSHTYTTAGSYTVSLTATSEGGQHTKTIPDLITVLAIPPVANFTATPVNGTSPLAVTFTDTSTGSVTSWHWDFGDGTSSTNQHPSHTYTTAGTYTVALTVTGDGGSATITYPNLISVTILPPIADFTATPVRGNSPLTVTFTDTSTGPVTSWHWDFGDGTTSTSQHPSHTYTSKGRYSVQLQVVGPGGTDSILMDRLISIRSSRSGRK